MTGTAETEREELLQVYGLKVFVVLVIVIIIFYYYYRYLFVLLFLLGDKDPHRITDRQKR